MRDIRDWSSPFRARSSTKTAGSIRGYSRSNETQPLTETPLVLKGEVEVHDAWVLCPKPHKRVLLREGRREFIVALEVSLVEHLDRVLLPIAAVPRQHDLCTPHVTSAPQAEAKWRRLTVEYEPSPSTRPKSKSSAPMRPLTELLRERDGPRDCCVVGARSSVARSSEVSVIPISRAR